MSQSILKPARKRSLPVRSAGISTVMSWTLAGLFLLLANAISAAENQPPAIRDFLQDNCIGCHDAGTQEGGLNLESLPMHLDQPENFHRWERIFDRVTDDEMPPDDTLGRNVKNSLLTSLGHELHSTDRQRIEKYGRVPARRLTRSQYEKNVCQLLAVDVPLQVLLPEDPLTDGYDTVARGQQISNHLMAAYLDAADVALDAAFDRVLVETPPYKKRLDWKQLQRREKNPDREPEGRPGQQDVVAWSSHVSYYGRMRNTKVPKSGRYRIRLSVSAVNPPNTGTSGALSAAGCVARKHRRCTGSAVLKRPGSLANTNLRRGFRRGTSCKFARKIVLCQRLATVREKVNPKDRRT